MLAMTGGAPFGNCQGPKGARSGVEDIYGNIRSIRAEQLGADAGGEPPPPAEIRLSTYPEEDGTSVAAGSLELLRSFVGMMLQNRPDPDRSNPSGAMSGCGLGLDLLDQALHQALDLLFRKVRPTREGVAPQQRQRET